MPELEQPEIKQNEQEQISKLTFGEVILQEALALAGPRQDIIETYKFGVVTLNRLHLMLSTADEVSKIIISNTINTVRNTTILTCSAMLYGDEIQFDKEGTKDADNT